jgi:hypothetical protein
MKYDLSKLPELHARFVSQAVEKLSQDDRFSGLAIGGSFLFSSIDEFSDLDFVVVVEPNAYQSVMASRHEIAAELGPLLAAFIGEHVGEPRLLICLYGPPLLHVDLKFVSLDDANDRIENPAVLFERDGKLTSAFAGEPKSYPEPDLQWIEDRFWIWVHYIATKIGRGELMEAQDALAFLRIRVLGPLALKRRGVRPTGVRKIEFSAPEEAADLQTTVVAYDRLKMIDALESAARIYRYLRQSLAGDTLKQRNEAEQESMTFVRAMKETLPGQQR